MSSGSYLTFSRARFSPDAHELLERFLRRGTPRSRPQQPAPPISSRGAARARARPRRRNLRRLPPQPTGLSCPLRVLTQLLAAVFFERYHACFLVSQTSFRAGLTGRLGGKVCMTCLALRTTPMKGVVPKICAAIKGRPNNSAGAPPDKCARACIVRSSYNSTCTYCVSKRTTDRGQIMNAF